MVDMRTRLLLLTDEVQRANLYYGIAMALRKNAQVPEFNLATNLFSGSYYACIRECVLAIAKLIILDRDALGMEKLLNYVEQNVGEFPRVTPEEVHALVSGARDNLRGLQPLAEKIELLRHKELAHLDPVHLKDPGAIIPVPIPYEDLRACLDLLIQILNRFLALHGSPQVIFENYQLLAEQELGLILAALKNRNAPAAA